MKKNVLLVLISACTLIMSAQQPSDTNSPGEIISFEKKLDLTPSGVAEFLYQCKGKEIPAPLLEHLDKIKKGIEAYKLTYYTKDYEDNIVKATGLVMIPKTYKKLSTVLYCRGTTVNRKSVASNLNIIGTILPLSYALNEYIVVAPDYYGMGGGDGTQNYTEAKTTVDSILYMFQAANTLLDQLNIERYNENFITGYSLGGHAGMATLKKVTEDNSYKFKHAYLGAGPHDLSYSTLQKGVIEREIFPISAFLASVGYTCHKIGYNIKRGREWEEIIEEKYLDKFIESNINDKGGIFWGPIKWRELFKKELVDELTNEPDHPLRKCLRASNVYDWYNTTPTTLVDGALDLIINPENNKVALEAQRAYYGHSLDKYKIKRLQTGPFSHFTGIIPWLVSSIYKFNTLRKGGFFNLHADIIYKSRVATPQQENTLATLQRSSIAPTLNINGLKENIALHKNNKSASRNTTETPDIYFSETIIDGKIVSFPLVVEKAIQLNPRDILQKKSDTEWMINLQGLSEKVTTIRFFNTNNEIVKTVVPSDKLSFTTDKLMGNETIEIVTENSIFTTPFNENIVESRIIEVKKNAGRVVVKAPSFSIKHLEVYNLLGKQVFSKNNIDANTYIFKNQEGIHLIKIHDAKGNVYTRKVAFK